MNRSNPFTKKLQVMQEIGGKYGINIETLTGDKTLIPGIDPIYQYLDPDDVNRVITLADGKAGDRFVIKHNGNWNDVSFLEVKVGITFLDRIYVGIFKTWIFDGTNWRGAWIGTGDNTQDSYRGIGIGQVTQVKECVVAIGRKVGDILASFIIKFGWVIFGMLIEKILDYCFYLGLNFT